MKFILRTPVREALFRGPYWKAWMLPL